MPGGGRERRVRAPWGECVARTREREARVAQGDAGPLREVLRRGRCVTLQVPDGEAGERFLAVDGRGPGSKPLLHAHPRRLPPDHRPAHDVTGDGGGDHQVHEPLAGVGDARRVEARAQLGSRLRSAGEGVDDDLHAACGSSRAHAFLAEPTAVPGRELWGGEGMEPPVVLGTHQVEGAPQGPRHDQLPVVERGVDVARTRRGAARPQREPEAAVVLGLDREEMSHRVDGGVRGAAREQFRAESGAAEERLAAHRQVPSAPRPRRRSLLEERADPFAHVVGLEEPFVGGVRQRPQCRLVAADRGVGEVQ